ncbi:Glycosyl transferases group 1 [Vibrio sp. B1REV9]|uniref:VpsD family glycosyltransferase n=1 Tax=Vibrio sp. B1REV9 TaxID=2751179 RepID=UPI001AF443E4|nr:VpsD family glycosyltransferase [Vibrio sp. B1REV9]CAE6928030.1 Glycosyl transferases group 1 [Vibrio sp. B1REV9]
MKKKVLLVVPLTTLDWGKLNGGGVDSVCQSLVQELQCSTSSEFHYRVLAFDPNNTINNNGELVWSNADIDIVRYNVVKNNRKKLPNIIWQTSVIRREAKIYEPDLIHAHVSSWALLRKKNTPIILTLHSFKKIGRRSRSFMNNILHEYIVPYLLKFTVDKYTCVSQMFANNISQYIPSDINTIYNPIDKRYFIEPRYREKSIIRLVTCGLIIEKKGIHDAIFSVKKLLKSGNLANLTIIGPQVDSQYLLKLKKLIRNLEIEDNIYFAGNKSTEEIISIYKNSNVGLFLSSEETFGLVPIEMSASGLPVVTTNVGVISEMNQSDKLDSMFYVCDGKDQNNISEKIIDAFNSTRLPDNANIKAKFSSESIVRNYENCYKKLLNVN